MNARKTFQRGDRVRYTGRHLRSIGLRGSLDVWTVRGIRANGWIVTDEPSDYHDADEIEEDPELAFRMIAPEALELARGRS